MRLELLLWWVWPFLPLVALGHTRLECPPPRSGSTGAKEGPCDAPDNPDLPPYPLQPGLNVVTWLESVPHPGAPGRFALSFDGSDDGFESCILLDHVPHDEQSQPTFMVEPTYHRASITLFIPDVKCERCNLQFITFMTDEFHGLPEGEQCVYAGAHAAGTVNSTIQTCDAVYHSCAPVSINGTVPRNEYECSLQDYVTELGWPFMGGQPAASTYFFKGNPGLYDRQTLQLLSSGSPIKNCSEPFYCDPEVYYNQTFVVPEFAKYTSQNGTCAAVVGMKVEPFELGKIPSVPKVQSNESVAVGSDANVSEVTVGETGEGENNEGEVTTGGSEEGVEEEAKTSDAFFDGRINTIFSMGCALILSLYY